MKYIIVNKLNSLMRGQSRIKHYALSIAAIATLSSCSDFLDILPMNEVVLENYWTEKSDVTSVVNSCY